MAVRVRVGGAWVVVMPGGGGGAPLSDDTPLAPGTAAPGTGLAASREDHVHPRQTTIVNSEISASAAIAISKLAALPVELGFAISDEVTSLTTGVTKLSFHMPFAMTLTAVRSSISTVSSSGLVTVDINEGGSTILSTKLSIDQSEKSSTTAATPAVISDAALADNSEITFDIDAAGTGAKGLKVWLIGTRA